MNMATPEVVLTDSTVYENTHLLTKDKDKWLVKEITINREDKEQ